MRVSPRTLVATAVAALACCPSVTVAATGRSRLTGGGSGLTGSSSPPATKAQAGFLRALNKGMRQAGRQSSAYVVDLDTGRALYSSRANAGRLPASVEKLYTMTTALKRFGADATFDTTLLGVGQQRSNTYTGTLYLRGGGDPTFGSAAFDLPAYGTGATMQQLVTNLVTATGIKRFDGKIVADETLFDSVRGTPATGYRPSLEVEGELSALAYDRGWTSPAGTALVRHPALTAGRALLAALRAAHVKVPRGTRVVAAATPADAQKLASVSSPPLSRLLALTLEPSDNFFAETLLKDLGARFGGAGTTAAGVSVVRSQVARSFGIHPRFNDGSGLSYYDRTTALQVETLLAKMASNQVFTDSLAVAGESGTLVDEMQHTYAQGRCRGKTGTLQSVSNLVGYCTARDGHTLAFALLMDSINPYYAHPIQDRMVVSIARYDG
jgi:serine-type D-Ala-D-Ala carboxypeptidase/endopeptidase (penicillin-binding protein 4)